MQASFKEIVLAVIFCSLCVIVKCVFVETTHGWIQGNVTRDAIVFLGVPFAQPPKRYVKLLLKITNSCSTVGLAGVFYYLIH